jgi:hypothetical protein
MKMVKFIPSPLMGEGGGEGGLGTPHLNPLPKGGRRFFWELFSKQWPLEEKKFD